MIELPHDISPQDVQQWLEGGVFFAKPSAKEDYKLATLSGVPSRGIIRVYWVAVSGRRDDVANDWVRPHWPRCGAVNMPSGFAVDVERLQRKQYRRTFNARCVRVSVPGKWYCLKRMEAAAMQVDPSSPDFLRAVFHPEYPADAAEAMERLRTSNIASIAVNPQIVMLNGPRPRVYYRGEFVGRYNGDEFIPDPQTVAGPHVAKLLGGSTCKL